MSVRTARGPRVNRPRAMCSLLRDLHALLRVAAVGHDLRPVLVVQNNLDVLKTVPLERWIVPDLELVHAVERASLELDVLDPRLRDQSLVVGAEGHRYVSLGGESLAMLDTGQTEIEYTRIAVVVEYASVRGVVLA